jgi:hypothetical protein
LRGSWPLFDLCAGECGKALSYLVVLLRRFPFSSLLPFTTFSCSWLHVPVALYVVKTT